MTTTCHPDREATARGAVAFWIDGLFDHVCTKRASTRGCNSVVVDFEPQEHAMTDGRAICVDEVRMIFSSHV